MNNNVLLAMSGGIDSSVTALILQEQGFKVTGIIFLFYEDSTINIYGIFHYTIGQRRGLGVNFNMPVFVSELRYKTNEVVLADFDELYRNMLYLQYTHFVSINELNGEKMYTLKIRYRLQETPCKVRILSQKIAVIELLNLLPWLPMAKLL